MITPDIRTYSDFVSDLQELFATHVDSGIHLDGELCSAFADGLNDLHGFVEVMERHAAAHGYQDGDRTVMEGRRSTAARRELVLDVLREPGTNIFRLPDLAPRGATHGGDAA
ncbi:hypothetical protein [Microvirga terricola]|uniref:Uncharacterized protein n=1 Tax=Microvirga terricola TaxID=2719797 RepID=A0ABX0V6E8_9HYPH|nr:hypothetical protein [Microvirga terricola]NIX75414.1 hypothetical protein [Microvirga terricola]